MSLSFSSSLVIFSSSLCSFLLKTFPGLHRDSKQLKFIFELAKDLLNGDIESNGDDIGSNKWKTSTIRIIDSFNNINTRYLSFFQPQNQFKGIGNSFEANTYAFPRAEVSKVGGMKDVLIALGL